MTEAIENPLLAVEELIKITTSLSTERDLHQLLNMILTSARKLTHADAGMIYLLDSTKRNLFVDIFQCNSLDSKGKSLSVVPLYAGDVRNSSNVISYCAFSGKTINIPDVYKYSGFDFSDIYQRDKMTGYKTKSVVAIPLTDHEEITVGILLLVNIADPITGQIVPLPEELSQLVGAFASQAAVAIDNVQLIENNQRLIEILNHTNRELAEENRKLREKIVSQYDFSRIIGHGEKMKKIFALMEKVFNSVATVLIRGETGTGKELIAQTIHYNSPRRKGEFVAQNCAALPEN
jgi:sigma-54-dependent transcriptional regulator